MDRGFQIPTPGTHMESTESKGERKYQDFIDTSVKLDNEGNMKAKERES
jgi:hypothetical protein